MFQKETMIDILATEIILIDQHEDVIEARQEAVVPPDVKAEKVGVLRAAQFITGEDTEIVVRARVLFEVLVLETNDLP